METYQCVYCGLLFGGYPREGKPRKFCSRDCLAASRATGCINNRGYRLVRAHGHPNAYERGVILEHVLVMSEMVGRPLHSGESVHHKNGDRLDNRPKNLELWSDSQPKGQRVRDKIAWAKEILEVYGHGDWK